MDKIVYQVSERLAAASSRRGFMSIVGKVALGAAAIAAGQGLGEARAAGVSPDNVSIACCSGVGCQNLYCPAGSHYQYNWQCCLASNCFKYQCNDCYYDAGNPNGTGYECTFPSYVCPNPFSCPCC